MVIFAPLIISQPWTGAHLWEHRALRILRVCNDGDFFEDRDDDEFLDDNEAIVCLNSFDVHDF
jgi:hypothetical protein